MRLSLDTLKQITLGVQRIEENENGFSFFRFSKEQEEMYKETAWDSYVRTFVPAGVKLYFKTDSKSLKIKTDAYSETSRRFYAFDVFKDGKMLGSLKNFSEQQMPKVYSILDYPLDDNEAEFDLGEGEKEIEVYLPWSIKANIEFFVDDAAFIEAIRPKHKMISFGDSITHGCDSRHPSNRYTAILAKHLDAEELCFGIGGEHFNPLLAEVKIDYEPDIITVAYGTNDFWCVTREVFREHCEGFFKALCENYPNTPIYAITPIWRKDKETATAFGKFEDTETEIRKIAEKYSNVKVISGLKLVPWSEDYFGDGSLHPNDEGFKHYAENLIKEIEILK